MDILEYQSIIEKTAVYPKHLGTAYTTLGMIGELGEFAVAVSNNDDENIKKEAGDVFWYITATCSELGIKVTDVFHLNMTKKWTTLPLSPDEAATEAILISTEVSEMIKKFCRDGNIDLSLLVIKLHHIFYQIVSATSYYGINVSEIFEANYTKLIKRRETNTLHGSGDNREELTDIKHISNGRA